MKKVEVFLKKKFIPSLFLMMCVFNINAQGKWETKEKTYRNGVYIEGAYDFASNKFISMERAGKNVEVIYDPFYDSYKINFDLGHRKINMILNKSRVNSSNETVFIDNYMSENKPKSEFLIINTIDKEKKLILTPVLPIFINGKKYKMVLFFDDLN